MAERGEEPAPRFRTWTIVTSVLLFAALAAAVVWGLVLAYRGGQTPSQSYLLTAVLTILSIAGGWIIAVLMYQSQKHDREIADRQRQADVERTARSAVTRSFRIMGTMERIQSHTDDEASHPIAELRTRMRVIREGAIVTYSQTYDAIEDWRRFAPEAVNDEIAKARMATVRQGEGWE